MIKKAPLLEFALGINIDLEYKIASNELFFY